MHLPPRVSRYNTSQDRQAVQPAFLTRPWQRLQQTFGASADRQQSVLKAGKTQLFTVSILLFLISYRADGPRWSKGQVHAAWQFYLAVSQQANNIEDTPAFVSLGEKYKARTSVTTFIRLIRCCVY